MARRIRSLVLAAALALPGGTALAHGLDFALAATEAGVEVALVYADGGRPAEARLSARSDAADVLVDAPVPAGETVTIPWAAAADGIVLSATDGADHTAWRLLTPADIEALRAASPN